MQKQYRVGKIFVSVQVNNPKGIKFWERQGYKIFSGPELQIDTTVVLHMSKELSEMVC
jgi:collagenase-like PrtC family protease